MRRTKAFTLLELMVVIAIVAVLAGVMVPFIARKRQASQRAACRMNLTWQGLAFSLYANDWHGWYPTTGVGVPRGREESLWSLSQALCYVDNDARAFVCPNSSEQAEFQPSCKVQPLKCMTAKGCSYAYDHQKPPKTPAGVAICADKPDVSSPGGRNSINHRNQGQNVLYFDCHVVWETNVNAGLNGDNIFTGNWLGPGGTLATTDTYCVVR